MEKKRVIICGAGSIGIYLGVMLSSRNYEVQLFGRKKLRGIKEKVYINNKEFEVPEKIFTITKNERYDFVFLTTKLYDLEDMIKTIRESQIKYPVLAEIQNGLVDASKYEKILNKKIIPVCVFSGFNLSGDKITINSTPIGWKTENSAEGKKVSKIISDAGVLCTPDKNLDSLRAEKMIINCSLNGLSAIEDKPFSLLFKNKRTRERIERLFHECYNILKKEYKLIPEKKMKERMYKNWSKLNHYSSTHQDFISGRKVELDFFNGYLVRIGKEYSLPTEENQKILDDFKRLKKK